MTMNPRLWVRNARARLQSGTRQWYEIRNHDSGTTEVFIYDEISWFGIAADEFVRDLQALDVDEFTLRINSPGGSVFDGIAIFNAVRQHRARVTVHVDSLAASIASVIAMAGDKIVMQPHSQLMMHEPFALVIGDADDMRQMADMLDKQSDNIAGVYAEQAGGTIDDWRGRMRAETWYLAGEAVKAGLADEVAPTRRKSGDGDGDGGDPADRWDLSVFRYAGRAEAPPPLLPSAATRTEPTATAVGPHKSEAREGRWSRSDNEKRLPEPVPLTTARKFYAAYDETRVEDGAIPKGAGHLPHHFVSEDGTPGAASINGVNAALARLNQTDISESERRTAERHLRNHQPADEGEEDHTHVEPTGQADPEPEPDPVPAEPAAEPEDEWAAAVAHLTDQADHDDEFARLMEAL